MKAQRRTKTPRIGSRGAHPLCCQCRPSARIVRWVPWYAQERYCQRKMVRTVDVGLKARGSLILCSQLPVGSGKAEMRNRRRHERIGEVKATEPWGVEFERGRRGKTTTKKSAQSNTSSERGREENGQRKKVAPLS